MLILLSSGYGNLLVNLNMKSFLLVVDNGILKRRNMVLDSYVCELCILQREETILHLFIRCNFAKACRRSIGLNLPTHIQVLPLIKVIKRKLKCLSIWTLSFLCAGASGQLEINGFLIILIQQFRDAGRNSLVSSRWCYIEHNRKTLKHGKMDIG